MAWKQLAKAPLRAVAVPVLRRIEDRVQRPLTGRIDELSAAFGVMRAELDALNRAFPATLAAISPDAAESSLRASLDELARRVEFVRKELLFELRYGQRSAGEVPDPVESRILNPAKLREMQGEIRLNLGAGHVGRPGYLNVDARVLEGIDVVADVRALPFEKGSVSEIYSAHVLEHFPLEELRSVLMPYWVSLLKDGGRFVAVVPDMETMIAEYMAGRFAFEALREVTYGTQEYEGDFHYNGFSQANLRSLLQEVGLSDVTMAAIGRRNGMCYEMEIVGRRSAVTPG